MSKYRKAAERIFHGHSRFCCDALIECNKSSRKFQKYMYHPESELHPTFLGQPSNFWFGKSYEEENQLARQLALLFMEQIEKDER